MTTVEAPTASTLILVGIAIGIALALPPIRGYLGAGAALVTAAGLYLADGDDGVNPLWHKVAVVTLVVAVVAGVAAVCDGPSAALVGVMGAFLGLRGQRLQTYQTSGLPTVP